MEELRSDDKLKKICDVLRDRTLKPAEKEAEEILQNALEEASIIVRNAEKEAIRILEEADNRVTFKLEQGKAALNQAGKRVLDFLKQTVERQFFTSGLRALLDGICENTEIIARLVEALVNGMEKGSGSGNLIVLVSKNLSPRKINECLAKDVLKKLDSGGVTLGDFSGGVRLKVRGEDVILDFSSEALQDLFSRFLQKDFREMVFQESRFEGTDSD